MTAKRRKIFFRILLLSFVAFSLILFFGETIARLYMNKKHPDKLFRYTDDGLVYDLLPSAAVETENQIVKINHEGFRGAIIAQEKKAKRIFFIGDSMIFGFGLNEKQTLPVQLQNIARKDMELEVLNAGVIGYNTRQERIVLEKKLLDYNPDVVILGFCQNDIEAGLCSPTFFNALLDIGDRNYCVEDFNFGERCQRILLRNSALFQFLVFRWRNFYYERIKGYDFYDRRTTELLSGNLDKTMDEIKEKIEHDVAFINRACKEKGIDFLIINYGIDEQFFNEELRWPQKWLQELCKKHKIYFLDSVTVFEKHVYEHVMIDQGHPSAFGNYVLAEALWSLLERIVKSDGQ